MSHTNPLPRAADGIVLRRLAASDLGEFQAYRGDDAVGRYQGWRTMRDEEARSFLADMSRADLLQPGVWSQIAIAEPGSLTLLGNIGLLLSDDQRQVEIGFTLSRSSHGRGIATLAVREAIRLVFEPTPAQRVIGITDASNPPSIRVLERVGMSRIESRQVTFRGEPCTEHVDAVVR